MKRNTLVLFTILFASSCGVSNSNQSLGQLSFDRSELTIDTSFVEFMRGISGQNQERMRHNTCECRTHGDTLYIQSYVNTGWELNEVHIQIVKGIPKAWVHLSDDVNSLTFKVPIDAYQGNVVHDNIQGKILLKKDTTFLTEKVHFNIEGNFNCRVVPASEEWLKLSLTKPDSQRIFK